MYTTLYTVHCRAGLTHTHTHTNKHTHTRTRTHTQTHKHAHTHTTYHLCNFYKLRPYINKNTAILLTHSLILSRLNYCNTLLTGQTKTTLKRLDAIINRSIRIIYKLKKYDYTTSITDLRLNWMTTTNFIDYKLLTILNKTLTYDQPYNLRQVLNMKVNYRQLRSSHLITLSLPPMPLNSVGNKSFRHLASNKWKHLPKILVSPTINMFKRKLKSFLLR